MNSKSSLPLLCVLFIATSPAEAVMRLTDISKNGIVRGGLLCFDVQHGAAKTKGEFKSPTNTKQSLACDFLIRPYVEMNGTRGLTNKLSTQSKSILIPYRGEVSVCFDYGIEIDKVLASKAAQDLRVLGIGELETACVPQAPRHSPVSKKSIRASRSTSIQHKRNN